MTLAPAPRRYSLAGLFALDTITDAQASTLGQFAAAGIFYSGRCGSDAFAEGEDLTGRTCAFVVSPDGTATAITAAGQA